LLGSATASHGLRKGPSVPGTRSLLLMRVAQTWARYAKERPVLDLAYVGLTIVVFAALWLLVKGVERFER
jgi:hypothetical protein